ncbi:MAG TPA: EAL domain-containing protein [Solirubrobacter sp.]|nr:EAL domain-containing protein [Solirubrobacter sp.]
MLATAEELREVLVAQQRELDRLRREADHAELLIEALDALLDVDGDADPFAGVFAVLQPLFGFARALVLAETDRDGTLRCIAASTDELVGREYEATRIFEKVLSGRVTATLSADAEPALYLPLGFRERRGLMALLRPEGVGGFDRRDIVLARKLALLASHAFAARLANRSERERRRLHGLAEELKAAQAMLAHRANHDALTGLPNRAYIEEHVQRRLRQAAEDERFALAFIDLDGFKQVNDLYGHSVGDGLLTAVAERIRRQIRDSDVLARVSGDEFVLALDPIDDLEALDRIVARILVCLKETFNIDGASIMLSASIGLAVHPDHGTDYEQLRRNADVAMYSAKAATRGSAAYFDAEIGRAAARRTTFEQVLRRAVSERRFASVLQPKVSLETFEVTGFEALARRVGGDGALHTPAEFIEPATQLGLLDPITEIVLDEVVAVAPALGDVFGEATTISVNVSAHQATDPATMRRFLQRLASSGRPERFIVELTEDALLQSERFQRDVIPLFRESGVRVSIDDFGTGYASLATLIDITAHELKIDRVFISRIHERPRTQVLMRGLAAVSRELGVKVVAEGVETVDELAYLQSLEAFETAQGYLFARPQAPAELIAGHGELTARLRQLAVLTG